MPDQVGISYLKSRLFIFVLYLGVLVFTQQLYQNNLQKACILDLKI